MDLGHAATSPSALTPTAAPCPAVDVFHAPILALAAMRSLNRVEELAGIRYFCLLPACSAIRPNNLIEPGYLHPKDNI